MAFPFSCGAGALPAERQSSARPSRVNETTVCAPPGSLELSLPLHAVGQIAISERRSDCATHAEPAKSQGECEGGFSILGNCEIIVVGDITQVGSFNIDTTSSLSAFKVKLLGFSTLTMRSRLPPASPMPRTTARSSRTSGSLKLAPMPGTGSQMTYPAKQAQLHPRFQPDPSEADMLPNLAF